tara:strand:+ start:215 stop:1111 length:897 start_codon:yes stop_codon:yes gene_type:complete
MNVNRKKILVGDIGTGTTINVPLSTTFYPVDNTEMLEHKFIEDEVEKSINPIIDYKKIMFKPAIGDNWDLINNYVINLNFYTPDSIQNNSPEYRNPPTYNGAGVYEDLGYIYDDLFCRTNRFLFSFCRLLFFDKPDSGNNSLLFFSDIFTQMGAQQINTTTNLPLPVSESPISFLVNNPQFFTESFAGYYMYWYKDLVDNSPNQEYDLYMTLIFNNAINGKSMSLAPSKTTNPATVDLTDLNGEQGKLFLKVRLKNDNGVYKYKFLPNTQQTPNNGGVNMDNSNNNVPTLTFWQINVS